MEKTRQIEQKYDVCDFCGKEIDVGKDALYYIHGDFPTVSVHNEPCLRQAVILGIRQHELVPA